MNTGGEASKRRPPGLVLVGKRSAAHAAARRTGIEFVSVVNAGSARAGGTGPRRVAMPFDAVGDVIGRVADDVRSVLSPRSVVALTEAAVLPAARLAEALKVPGLSVAAAVTCTDKAAMKAAVRAAGLRCAESVADHEELDRKRLIARLGLPMILKPRVGSGGRGSRMLHTEDEVPTSLPTGWMAETFVDGVELSVESFVVNGRPVWINFTEYFEPRWANIVPAQLERDTVAALHALNRAAIDTLCVRDGITHMEVFLTPGGPVFGELAARPPGGHIMWLVELAYGFDPWAALLAAAAGAMPELAALPSSCAGVRFLHPGPGRVRRIEGLDEIRNLPALVDLQCRLEPGQTVAPREGAGQSCGHVIFAGQRAAVQAGLAAVPRCLAIEVE